MKSDNLDAKHPLPDTNNIRKLLTLESDPTVIAIIRLAWQAGLTATEITSVKWSDANIKESTLLVSGRIVPICDELLSFLSGLKQEGPYVIYSRKTNGGPTTRNSVSRKARLALDSVGETDATLFDLRFSYITQLLREQPVEVVGRVTNCEIRTLQEIHKRYMTGTQDFKLERITKYDHYESDNASMERELDAEGNTLDAKIIMLAWMCGISLSEMSKTTWNSIDLNNRTLSIGGKKVPIPQKLFKILKAESAEAQANEHILKGTRSSVELTAAFLSRRAGEFFSRHGLDQLTINGIKGKYYMGSDLEVKEKILAHVQEAGPLSAKEIAAQFNLNMHKTHTFTKDLVSGGQLKYAGLKYSMPAYKSNLDRFLDAIEKALDSKFNLSRASLAEATGFASNLLQYYLSQAEKKGLLISLGHGVYHYTKENEYPGKFWRTTTTPGD